MSSPPVADHVDRADRGAGDDRVDATQRSRGPSSSNGSQAPRSEAMAPLQVPGFRRFWIAAIISNAGGWMQILAIPIAVFQVTGKATWIGITSMAGLVPSVVANVFSGTIADRFERRFVLFVSQALLAVAALALWILFRSDRPSLLVLCVVVAASAFVNGVSITTWQSFVPTLVPREMLGAAVRLNSMQFALGRALGPMLAAVAITRYGPRVGFIANAVSYLTVLVVLFRLPKVTPPAGPRPHPLRSVADGWRYVASHRSLALVPLFNVTAAIFGFAFLQLAAPIAVTLFHQPKARSSWLNVGFGVGGILGMAAVALIGERVKRSRVVPLWMVLWSVGLAGAAYSPNYGGAIAAFALVGIAQVTVSSSLNTALQMQVADEFRGRTVGVYMLAMSLGTPLGALVFGTVIDHHGARFALLIGGALLVGVAAIVVTVGIADLDTSVPSGRFWTSHRR